MLKIILSSLLRKFFSRRKYFKPITFFLMIFTIFLCFTIKPEIYIYSGFYEETGTCSPFFNDAKQFSVVIDNVKYPQRIPFYENATINFECLNSNEDHRY